MDLPIVNILCVQTSTHRSAGPLNGLMNTVGLTDSSCSLQSDGSGVQLSYIYQFAKLARLCCPTVNWTPHVVEDAEF